MAGSAIGHSTSAREDASGQRSRPTLNRKIWLPKLLYEALPGFYVAAGIAAFLATLYIGDWYWVVPHSLIVSAACFHLGLYVGFRRRRRRRDGQDAA